MRALLQWAPAHYQYRHQDVPPGLRELVRPGNRAHEFALQCVDGALNERPGMGVFRFDSMLKTSMLQFNK